MGKLRAAGAQAAEGSLVSARVRPLEVAHVHVGSRLAVQAAVDSAELTLFARDLGGTATDVLVAAVGRALRADPTSLLSPRAGVGLAVPTAAGVAVPVLAHAATAPLPELRDEVHRLVRAARRGRLAPWETGDPAVVLDHIEFAAGEPGAAGPPAEHSVLVLASQPHGLDLSLSVVADADLVDARAAAGLLQSLVRLLERPYRRLA